MKAILVEKNKELIWSDVPNPVMGEEDVLVEIHYAAINRADLMQRDGDYPPPPGCPDWMGLEISGIIKEMGKVAKEKSNFKVGDAVCALLGGGGYAEYVNVKYDMLMPVPEGCSLLEAAAMPEAFATSYLNLFIEGKIERGNTLLMHAGASGLASVLIPMARAFGIRVISTVINDEYIEKVKKLGAEIVVNTKKEDIAEVLKKQLDEGHPVDVAIDCLGGEMMGRCLPYMQRGGRWIMLATLAGDMTEVNLKNIYVRNIRIIGSTLRSRTPAVKAQILSELVKNIWPKVTSGEVRATVHATYPITEAEEGQRQLSEGKSVGKVVLVVKE